MKIKKAAIVIFIIVAITLFCIFLWDSTTIYRFSKINLDLGVAGHSVREFGWFHTYKVVYLSGLTLIVVAMVLPFINLEYAIFAAPTILILLTCSTASQMYLRFLVGDTRMAFGISVLVILLVCFNMAIKFFKNVIYDDDDKKNQSVIQRTKLELISFAIGFGFSIAFILVCSVILSLYYSSIYVLASIESFLPVAILPAYELFGILICKLSIGIAFTVLLVGIIVPIFLLYITIFSNKIIANAVFFASIGATIAITSGKVDFDDISISRRFENAWNKSSEPVIQQTQSYFENLLAQFPKLKNNGTLATNLNASEVKAFIHNSELSPDETIIYMHARSFAEPITPFGSIITRKDRFINHFDTVITTRYCYVKGERSRDFTSIPEFQIEHFAYINDMDSSPVYSVNSHDLCQTAFQDR